MMCPVVIQIRNKPQLLRSSCTYQVILIFHFLIQRVGKINIRWNCKDVYDECLASFEEMCPEYELNGFVRFGKNLMNVGDFMIYATIIDPDCILRIGSDSLILILFLKNCIYCIFKK